MKKNVLLSDNHLQFLETRAEYLELAGYHVIKASSPEQAQKTLINTNVHLIILDVRLTNDDDEFDKSGLEIAYAPSSRFIPSIIMTDYPTVDDVRDVLRPGSSSVVDYVFKKDGPQKMVDAVKNAFEKYVPINWNLIIHWDEESGLSIPGLIGIIEKTITSGDFSILNEEVEDLLRMTFYEYDEVTILRKLWGKNDRIALLVQARHQRSDRYFVLTFGYADTIETELSGQDYFPDEQGESGTIYIQSYRRAHYAANLWRLRGVNSDEIESLDDVITGIKEGMLGNIIENMFQNTLKTWHNQSEPCELSGNSADFYRKKYPLYQNPAARQILLQRVNEIAREARRLNLINALSIENDCLKINLGGRHTIELPDPSIWLSGLASFSSDGIYYTRNSPGKLDLDSILVRADGITWLTDLIHAGEYPIWHDYARLETEMRFTLLDSTNLEEIYDLENQLRPAWPVDLHESINVSTEKRKYGSAILRVRDQAYKNAHHAPGQYAQCLLFNVVSELSGSELPSLRSRKDTARMVHHLMLAGMICADMSNIIKDTPQQRFLPLVVDETKGIVFRGNKVIDVTDTEFRLLSYLYQNAGKTCDREAICHDVFNIESVPEYNQIHGQIDANLNRLREKIEPDPKSPRYIITLHGRGVRLIKNPQELHIK